MIRQRLEYLLLFGIQVFGLLSVLAAFSERFAAGLPFAGPLWSTPRLAFGAMLIAWAILQAKILRSSLEGDLRWASMLLTSLPLAFVILAVVNRML